MFDDSWTSYLNEFLEFVKPVSDLVWGFFDRVFAYIPDFEKLFSITIGILFLLVGLQFFDRLVNE